LFFFVASLKELDARALQTLAKKVNVIPIIAKADTMTAEEKVSFKHILLRDLQEHGIKTFPSDYPDEVDGAEELLVSTFWFSTTEPGVNHAGTKTCSIDIRRRILLCKEKG
jgi:septin family protein